MMAFSKDARHLRVSLGYIFERIAALDAKALSADLVYDVLQLVASALEKAKLVRRVLIRNGRISSIDADKAYKDAMARALSTLASTINKKEKNRAARDSMDAHDLMKMKGSS